MSNPRTVLDNVVNYLNEMFSEGHEPQVIKINGDTIISTWACGAIVYYNKMVYFVMEDDGYWFYNYNDLGEIGYQKRFSSCRLDSFQNALENLNKYLKNHNEE